MIRNEPTLPESRRRSLIAASSRDAMVEPGLLENALGDADERIRVLALRALARRGEISVEQWLSALSDEASEVRREAANLLADSTERATSLDDALGRCLCDSEPLVVDAAAFALGERGVLTAVPGLIDVAREHEDARCRECAVAALGALGDDRARSTIIAALNDKPPVRRRAIVALANFEGPDVDAALDTAREDRDWQVRSAVDQLERPPTDD